MWHSDPTVYQLTAAYEPTAHGDPLTDVVVRPVRPADLLACGRLAARREGGTPEVWADRLALGIDHGQVMFVAEAHGVIVGYGRVAWQTPTACGGRNAPDGWYLSGVAVDPSVRRQGIGRALTRARCAWVLERADSVYYVVNAANRASQDLHAGLGFTEVTRDFDVPGLTFTGAEGILCRADGCLAEVVDLDARR